MPTRGIKRKSPGWEESVPDGHLSFQTDHYTFRQFLLNLSLEKFNKGRSMADPSWRRYVLIANTLRVIQEEICRENLCSAPDLDHSMSTVCEPLSRHVVVPAFPDDLENILLPTVEDECSVTTAIASILKELESVLDESCPQNPQSCSDLQKPEAKLESSTNNGSNLPSSIQPSCDQGATAKEEVFSSDSESLEDTREMELLRELVQAASCSESAEPMDTSVMEQVPTEVPLASTVCEAPIFMDATSVGDVNLHASSAQSTPSVPLEELKAAEAVFGSFEIMNSSYLNDVCFDDPFSDIDTSVFERETFYTGSSTSSRLSSLEELWFPSHCNIPSYSSSPGLRETNDLENIMEILVGS